MYIRYIDVEHDFSLSIFCLKKWFSKSLKMDSLLLSKNIHLKI